MQKGRVSSSADKSAIAINSDQDIPMITISL